LPEGLVSIENMAFYGCNSLTSISIPDSVTSIGGDAFYWCIKLKTVSLSRKTKFEADSFRKDTELVYRD
jgi:hypothetical protein